MCNFSLMYPATTCMISASSTQLVKLDMQILYYPHLECYKQHYSIYWILGSCTTSIWDATNSTTCVKLNSLEHLQRGTTPILCSDKIKIREGARETYAWCFASSTWGSPHSCIKMRFRALVMAGSDVWYLDIKIDRLASILMLCEINRAVITDSVTSCTIALSPASYFASHYSQETDYHLSISKGKVELSISAKDLRLRLQAK